MKELLKRQVEQIPVSPRNYKPDIPDKFAQAILKALEKHPRKRYYSCREFAIDLEDALTGIVHYDYDQNELRWDPRVTVNLKAGIQANSDSDLIPAQVINLSVNGASLRMTPSLETGNKLWVELYLPENGNLIQIWCKATVLWKDSIVEGEQDEIGVSLDGLEKRDKQYIGLHVRDLLLS